MSALPCLAAPSPASWNARSVESTQWLAPDTHTHIFAIHTHINFTYIYNTQFELQYLPSNRRAANNSNNQCHITRLDVYILPSVTTKRTPDTLCPDRAPFSHTLKNPYHTQVSTSHCRCWHCWSSLMNDTHCNFIILYLTISIYFNFKFYQVNNAKIISIPFQ